MAIEKLLNEIRESEKREYDRAAKKYGKANNSAHESYAVIREEYEEAKEEEDKFELYFDMFWHNVKSNSCDLKMFIDDMREHAERAAAEWVQVAAMCYKATLKKEDK
jgi:hypothetical protein